MPRRIESFETTAGNKAWKTEADDGSIRRYVRTDEGTKQISPQSYGAYKSHTPATEKFKRGNLEQADSPEDLGFPFDRDLSRNVKAYEPGSEGRYRARIQNGWIGFQDAREGEGLSEMELAEDYQEMINRLQNATSEEQRDEIKEDYNIGGS